ncbi:hypothetical protein HYDPIDRAFT_174426 [Hydnomerulius pinastri MD-312]|nr:hypothetical protein HYDPIDRAFT_174426 [Hydnomerulius pinastri MD-312]
MTRRPSTVSVVSLGSLKGLGDNWRPSSATVALSPSSGGKLLRSVSQTGSIVSARPQDGITEIDPDELFTKHTIAEVKAKQIQLRADAEAKQEELRVMVGERYRDLLQASTSIISIATSAKRVQEALEETRDAIQSQRQPPVHSRISHGGKEDLHLRMLQVLSAHIKLLLDAPEHLWRLIEREKYFQAAWLFLLARVVHRALIRDDAQDEESWINQSIDVLEQFPLIQRQWETVSHFRTQIIHRATLSLRLVDKPYEETCATLLTLHILESRPLTDTLTIYLSHRTRALNTLLSKGPELPEQNGNGAPTIQVNGHPPERAKPSMNAPKPSSKAKALAVKTSTQTTLEAISQTVITAREIFGASSSTTPLAKRVLENVRGDAPLPSASALPTELLLNTQTVLAALPSSTYFSLLPPSIRSYKPFVDLSSASASLSQEFLREKLGDWYEQSLTSLRGTLDKWFSSLDIVSGVWRVRSSLRKWISQSGLEPSELSSLVSILDEVTSERIMSIWKAALLRAEKAFVQELASPGSDNLEEFSPLHSLYRPPPVPAPPPPGSGPSSFELPFQAYKETLTQQLEGRTPRLHVALRILEDAAASVQKDLAKMSTDGQNSRNLISELAEAYRPEAQALCVNVMDALTVSAEELMASPHTDTAIQNLVFHARLAIEFSTSSSFVPNIGCEQAVAADFREKMDALFARIITCWEEHVVSIVVSNYTKSVMAWRGSPGPTSAHPSPPVMECLYSLSSSIHSLGLVHHPSHLTNIAQAVIAKFTTAFIRAIDDGISLDAVQVLHDLTFLRCLASKWRITEITLIEKAIGKARLYLGNPSEPSKYDPDRNALECLARTQMLISALLPLEPVSPAEPAKESGDKMAALLTYGVPGVDVQFVPAVELAQPSSRFPLLLIDAR